MFINLSGDKIYIITSDSKIELGRGKLEREISQTIIDLYYKYLPQNIYILNGPGSFTNLRLGCLAINLLCYLLTKSNQILPKIYIIDKINVYKNFKLSILIYIGQKNNYRLLNNNEVNKVSINYLEGQNIYVDDLSDDIYLGLPKISFDYKDNKVSITYDDLLLPDINYNKDISRLFTLVLGNILPNYMIEPNIN